MGGPVGPFHWQEGEEIPFTSLLVQREQEIRSVSELSWEEEEMSLRTNTRK